MTTTTANRKWLTSPEAARHLRTSTDTLTERMRESDEATVRRAWVNGGGSGKSARYVFDIDEIDGWWREVNEWRERRSKSSLTGDTASAGATQTAANARAIAAPSASRKGSRPKSTRASQSGAAGRILAHGKALTSRPA